MPPNRRPPQLKVGPALPCDRCAQRTPGRKRLFDGRVVPLCPDCWRTGFTPEQRLRIIDSERRAKEPPPRCKLCEEPVMSPGAYRPDWQDRLCERHWRVTYGRPPGRRRRPARPPKEKTTAVPGSQAAPGKSGNAGPAAAKKRKKKRGSWRWGKSVRTVSGGAPGLGKRR